MSCDSISTRSVAAGRSRGTPRPKKKRARPTEPLAGIPVSRVRWRSAYRVIPSRFPPIQLFERVADPADLDAVFAIESMTNDRLRDEVGELALVPPADRVSGPGSSYIMAAFTHISPTGGRFTDGTFGAYYAAHDLRTAVRETAYHRAVFMASTNEAPMHLDMTVLVVNLDGELHDVRGMMATHAELYRPTDYSASHVLGRQLRAAGSNGVAYDSVRNSGGECAAVFRAPLLSRCRQMRHLTYVWDGASISEVYEKRAFRA
jgi:hypothetical protein